MAKDKNNAPETQEDEAPKTLSANERNWGAEAEARRQAKKEAKKKEQEKK